MVASKWNVSKKIEENVKYDPTKLQKSAGYKNSFNFHKFFSPNDKKHKKIKNLYKIN